MILIINGTPSGQETGMNGIVKTGLTMLGVSLLALGSFGSCAITTGIGIFATVYIMDSNTPPKEGIAVSASHDFSELTRVSRLSSLWPDAIDCEWTLKWINYKKRVDIPAPSDYEEILYGYVIVPPEESKRILAQYDWGALPAKNKVGGYPKDQQLARMTGLIPDFPKTDRTLLYSHALEQEMILGKYRYDTGAIFFDADRNTFFFYLSKRG